MLWKWGTVFMSKWSRAEIIAYYKAARDKRRMIKILAQLTGSDTETIVEVLKDAEELKHEQQ